MMLRWEGGAPPDGQEWIDVLSEVLGEESGFYWVRFYREPGGWRFDLERRCEPGPDGWSTYRRADESTALRVFTSLVEKGKRLDPSWSPSAASPPAVVVRMPPPSAQPADAAAPGNRQRTARETPPPANEMRTKPVSVAVPASRSERQHLSASARPATHRFPAWRSLRPVLVSTLAVLLVASAWWLSRDKLRWPPASPPTPSPPAALSQGAQTGHEEPEGITQPSPESAQASPDRRPAAPMPVGGPQRDSRQRPAQPSEQGGDEIRPPTPAPTRRPATPPPPPRHGELLNVNDPGLTPPAVVSQSCPPYPPLALERRLRGTVWLNALVDESGAVVEVSRVRASPPGVGFEDAATRCVLSRVYRPATKQDVPVRVRLPILIEFELPGR
jgi:protein TonB